MNFEDMSAYDINQELDALPDIQSQGVQSLADNISGHNHEEALKDVLTLLSVVLLELEELKNDTHRTKKQTTISNTDSS